MNTKVYTHEFIDIIGPARPQYMHHMTANWSPMAQEERNQSCFGVWGVVGTTSRWPRVVNMWEEDGFDGLALGLGHELGRPSLQDEKLEKWWNEAANYRSGGSDRILVPAPWTRTIEERHRERAPLDDDRIAHRARDRRDRWIDRRQHAAIEE